MEEKKKGNRREKLQSPCLLFFSTNTLTLDKLYAFAEGWPGFIYNKIEAKESARLGS